MYAETLAGGLVEARHRDSRYRFRLERGTTIRLRARDRSRMAKTCDWRGLVHESLIRPNAEPAEEPLFKGFFY